MGPLFRLLRIAFEVLRFTSGSATARLLRSRRRLPAPKRLCLSLARLGTTFIKFGQALSIRRDMLPDAYVAALQSLQDHIAPFPAQIAIGEIERALQRPLGELFERFDREPLAAASVAQVHAARLRDGRQVIVKVRRPHIKVQIDHDMRALAWVARIAVAFAPRLKGYRPLRVIDEIWSNLRKEIDFRQEARNVRRFATAFADWDTIHIPGVIDDLVSESAIVQERSSGRRIDDPTIAPDGPRLAQNLVSSMAIPIPGIYSSRTRAESVFMISGWSECLIALLAGNSPPSPMPSCIRIRSGSWMPLSILACWAARWIARISSAACRRSLPTMLHGQ